MELGNLENLETQVSMLIDERGGIAGVEADAMELKDIATSDDSWPDKAKDAVSAAQDPGAPGPDTPAA